MLKNYLKIAFRTLWKNRLFTGINLIGLSLGLASAGVLILFTQRGITFDAFHKDNDQLYYVQTEGKTGRYNQTVYPILAQLLKTFPEIETGTHAQRWNDAWISYKGKDIQVDTKYVDSTFLDIFSFALQSGDSRKALKNRESIVINRQTATSLFGDKDPVGESVTVNDTLHFTVTGVLADLPSNSSIQFEALVPIQNLEANENFRNNADWYNTFATVYLKLKSGTDVRKLESKFPAFVKTHFTQEVQDRKIRLAPLTEYIHYENPGFKWMITGAITISIFILLIISINLVNLNTAISFTRAKEVAVRKVTGSTLRQILMQFWTESGIVLVTSLLVSALFGVYYLIPQFNEFRKERMQLVLDWQHDYITVLILIGIICLIAFFAGTYPALYLNKLDIRDSVKGKISSKPHSKSLLRGTLIVVQFVISLGLVIGAIAVRKQITFMRKADMGFNQENVIVIKSDMQYKDETAATSQFKGIINDLMANSSVKDLVTSSTVPTKYRFNYNVYLPDGESNKEIRFRHAGTSSRFAETFGIKMLEGRDFSDELDQDGKNLPVVINESAMKAMGWKTAVGKRLRQKNNPEVYTVVGVMKDFHYQELKEKIEPLLHWYEGKTALNSYLSIKLQHADQAQPLLTQLERKMNKIPHKKPFQYFYLSDELSRQYNHLDGIWKMLNFVTMLSVIIAMAGIFGLITLAANQRVKEVGIRKTLGASVGAIVVLLSKEFIILVAISTLIGIPLGYAFAVKYLGSFEYHINIEWHIFLTVACAALALTMLTVAYQSIRTALMNPVKSLRNE